MWEVMYAILAGRHRAEEEGRSRQQGWKGSLEFVGRTLGVQPNGLHFN
jgi:hypothetical protein